MTDSALLSLFAELAEPARRRDAARDIARALGGEDLLLCIRDPQTGALIVAPGFPPTLPGGHAWRDFLEDCASSGQSVRELTFADGMGVGPVAGVAAGPDCVIALLGAATVAPLLALPEVVLRLLAGTLRAEHVARVATAREAATASAAAEAHLLVGELDTMRRRLERVNRDLSQALQTRDQFLRMASHELKTPLTGAKGFASLIERRIRAGDAAPEMLAGLVTDLVDQIRRMEALVLDLLDLARLEGGHLELQRERTDLRAIATKTIARFEAMHADGGRQLLLDAPDPVEGEWDGERVDDILANLVSNALKYSPEGSTVRVGVRAAGAWASVSVQDEGPGIEADELTRVFEPFYRGRRGPSAEGTGLGLSIARQLAQRHGGDITVASEPGQGSTFTLRLPLLPTTGATEAGTPARGSEGP